MKLGHLLEERGLADFNREILDETDYCWGARLLEEVLDTCRRESDHPKYSITAFRTASGWFVVCDYSGEGGERIARLLPVDCDIMADLEGDIEEYVELHTSDSAWDLVDAYSWEFQEGEA